MPTNDSPFFIVGFDRSGTTLLRLMLNEHHRLRIPRETHFLTALMDAFAPDRPLHPADLEAAYESIVTHTWWPQWGVADADLRGLLRSLDAPRLPELIDAIFRRLNNPDGKPRWGDKTPIYIRDMPRLHQVFPDAKFIHVIRDGRDVCVSLRQVRWWGMNVLKWAYHWSNEVRSGCTAGRALGPDVYIEVRYEDLVLETEQTLRHVCAFLGEPYDDGMRDFYRRAATEIAPGEQKIHTKTLRPPAPSDVRRWPRELTRFQVFAFELIAGDTMELAGQRRHFPRVAPLTRLVHLVHRTFGPVVRPLRDRVVTRFPALRRHL